MPKKCTYTYNTNYFDCINSSEKAYWLAFIWGDGYVCKRFRNGFWNYEFKLSLSEIDNSHLLLFRGVTSKDVRNKKHKGGNFLYIL
jgi:hypothetical protein